MIIVKGAFEVGLGKGHTFLISCLVAFVLPGFLKVSALPSVDSTSTGLKELKNRAQTERLKGNDEAALDFLEQAVAQASKEFGADSSYVANMYYEMGVMAFQATKFQRAEQFLNEAVRLNPNSVGARVKLSELLTLRERFDEAIQQASLAIGKRHNSPEARKALAMAYQKMAGASDMEDSRRSFARSRATQAFAQLDFVAHGKNAAVIPLAVAVAPAVLRPPARVPQLPTATPLPQPNNILPLPITPALPVAPAPKPKASEKPKAPAKSKPKAPKSTPPPPTAPKPIAPKPRTLSAPRPSAHGLVPPPPPVAPVYPGLVPPPPPMVGAGNPGFQLKTEAKVKTKEKPKEAPKEDKPAHPSASGEDSDFLLDWAADKGGKKKSN